MRCPWTDNDGEQCTWPPHKGNVHRLASVAEETRLAKGKDPMVKKEAP